MTRIRIDISFKGTDYHGWQIQENAFTVQEELNQALSVILRENIETTGCGRTDTGVHARQFTAHFDCVNSIDDFNYLKFKLNTILSKNISVNGISKTYLGFHSRFDAVKRTYKYFIHTAKNPFKNEYSTFVHYRLDIDRMNEAAALLTGNKDFTSFSKLHTDVTDNFCNVFEAEWTQTGEDYVFTISANRFLRNMVRAIVGTMLDIGRNKVSDFAEIINAKDRSKAGISAPPQGLFLWENLYRD
ncbi:MAG: tRNA pseudouridine(38-40) synthase TruA [Prevotellaceae bacterium]|jgi:tRNA pseudouridine38-40 synthase|nr:tRNA pseudouridine(38-40) synthase TruA [Prevotellaceae bacterium]